MFFTNKAYTLVINTSIVEYDIKSANTSVMEYYKMIPQPKIDMIKEMSKQERVVKIGKMMRAGFGGMIGNGKGQGRGQGLCNGSCQ